MESSACRRRASDADQSAAARAYSATAECEPVMVKEEPDCGVCGVSEAAMAEGLYADHEVKGELVIGPELLQQQDIIYSKHNVLVIKEESQYKPKLAGEPTPHPGAPTAAPGMALAAAAAPSSSTGSGAVLSDWSDYHWETCIEARRLMLAVIMCWLSKKRVHTSQS
ncbi:hypothetical protein MSG28_014781 [Choristoneura fumiferana]|uniref:Uncharacterized protein n=1 Tax=Choristoneura fumiferana TaxID=7141 RepID=A0ACC0JSM4_CHOFU|nr:hypothetical protein MSG28_014781 [Choristoneura fumiferana]